LKWQLKESVFTQGAKASSTTLQEDYAHVIAAVYGVSAKGKGHN
jgi:hypothetical protein